MMGAIADRTTASSAVARCSSHPSARAGWRCSGCGRLLCPDCAADASRVNVKLVACVQCGSMAEPLMVSKPVRPWPAMLPAFAKAVLSGRGLGQYFVVAVIMSVGMLIGLVPILGWILSPVVIYGVWGSYLFTNLRAAADGADELPSMQEMGSSSIELVSTTFRLALATAIIWVPLVIYIFLHLLGAAFGTAMISASNWHAPFILLLQIAGAIYLPAAFILAAMADSVLDVVNPVKVFAVIARVPGQYFGLALFCVVLYAGNKLLEFGLYMVLMRYLATGSVGLVGAAFLAVVVQALTLILPSLTALALGRFMFQNAAAFGLRSTTPTSQPALPGAVPHGRLPQPDQAGVDGSAAAPVAPVPVALELETTPAEALVGALKSGHDGMVLDAYQRLASAGKTPALHPDQELALAKILDTAGDVMGAVHACRRAAQADLRGPLAPRALFLAASLLIEKASDAASGQTLLDYLIQNYPGDPWAERAARLKSG